MYSVLIGSSYFVSVDTVMLFTIIVESVVCGLIGISYTWSISVTFDEALSVQIQAPTSTRLARPWWCFSLIIENMRWSPVRSTMSPPDKNILTHCILYKMEARKKFPAINITPEVTGRRLPAWGLCLRLLATPSFASSLFNNYSLVRYKIKVKRIVKYNTVKKNYSSFLSASRCGERFKGSQLAQQHILLFR